jgi:hypothetical protein
VPSLVENKSRALTYTPLSTTLLTYDEPRLFFWQLDVRQDVESAVLGLIARMVVGVGKPAGIDVEDAARDGLDGSDGQTPCSDNLMSRAECPIRRLACILKG